MTKFKQFIPDLNIERKVCLNIHNEYNLKKLYGKQFYSLNRVF